MTTRPLSTAANAAALVSPLADPTLAPAAATAPSAIAFIAPRATSLAASLTPTVAQFLDAANAQYLLTTQPPPGLAPLIVNGQTLAITDNVTGLSGEAYLTAQRQVIIAFQGTTGGEHLLTNPAIVLTQLVADIGIFAQTVTPAEAEAAALTRIVVADAAAQGISAANVFLTGHSLGAIEAEYAAQKTGLGGIGFEPTGIPKSAQAGSGANFVDVVTYGDPVGNYSSDIAGEQPFAPAYAPGQAGALPHYGTVVMIGSPSDQASLKSASAIAGIPIIGDLLAAPGLESLVNQFHLPGTQAHDLGVALSPYSSLVDGMGTQTGPVTPAATDTIPQLLAQFGHGAGSVFG